MFLLTGPRAPASTISAVLPDAQYRIHVYIGMENSASAMQSTAADRVGCTAQLGGPICAAALVSAVPSPTIIANAITAVTQLGQTASAEVNIPYYYEVLCGSCTPGKIVPLQLDGYLQFGTFLDQVANDSEIVGGRLRFKAWL